MYMLYLGHATAQITLKIDEKRRETKGKGEKERYTYLNAEFQEQEGEIRKPPRGVSPHLE